MNVSESALRVVADGLEFPESPRWHDNKLIFSDVRGRRVYSISQTGAPPEAIVDVPLRPSGLGWLPDGEMLIVSMEDRRVVTVTPQGLVTRADLSGLARGPCNDMVVGGNGNAYVGDVGYEVFSGAAARPGVLMFVPLNGPACVVAEDVLEGNGIVLTTDETVLLIAETQGARITRFNVNTDGTLSSRGVFAPLPSWPDGICLDADGCVWAALPALGTLVRVEEGGNVIDSVDCGDYVSACMLGGVARRTLFMTSADPGFADGRTGTGRIRALEVQVPGAGLP